MNDESKTRQRLNSPNLGSSMMNWHPCSEIKSSGDIAKQMARPVNTQSFITLITLRVEECLNKKNAGRPVKDINDLLLDKSRAQGPRMSRADTIESLNETCTRASLTYNAHSLGKIHRATLAYTCDMFPDAAATSNAAPNRVQGSLQRQR